MSNYSIHDFKPGTRLAFDENINDRIMGKYARAGCVIVYVSPQGMEDEDWISEAINMGAEIILSYDSDIGNILDKWDIDYVQWRIP